MRRDRAMGRDRRSARTEEERMAQGREKVDPRARERTVNHTIKGASEESCKTAPRATHS